jgi:error-prone DNA polymerase
LALGMLTCIRKSFDLIERHYGRTLSLASVPRDDAAVYAMLSRADSVGVFQVESRAQMSMLPRLQPACFYDLVIEVAIVRPGPIQGDMVHPYLRRRSGSEPVTYPSEALRAVLHKTLGVPLFQEQAMQIAIVAAGFTADEADKLRRAMATFRHVGTIHTFRAKFIAGMEKNGYERAFAERCFSQIEGFGEYGFPESHAASFAHLVYVSSWIKCHHPDAFCAAILNSQPMGFYQPAQLVRDAREHRVEVRHPDLNASEWDCTLEPLTPPSLPQAGRCTPLLQIEEAEQRQSSTSSEKASEPPVQTGRRCAIRLGLRLIGGLAEKETKATILHARGSGYTDMASLWTRSGAPVSMLERLADADVFRSMGLDRRAALWAVKGLGGGARTGDKARPPRATSADTPLLTWAITGTITETMKRHIPRGDTASITGETVGSTIGDAAASFAGDLFDEAGVELPEITLGEHVVHDYASLSLSLKAHPICFFRDDLARRRAITSAEHWDERLAGKRVSVAGLVLVRQRPGTAKGVIFITLEDETGIVNVVVWPKVFEKNRRTVMTAQFLLVRGKIEREGLVIHVVADELIDLSHELKRLGEGTAGTPRTDREVREGSWKPKSRDFH